MQGVADMQELGRTASALRAALKAAADARTHPSRNYFLPHMATRDAAHAETLLAVYCGRLCEWGREHFDRDSVEARVLVELGALSVLLTTAGQAGVVDARACETEAHASAVLSLTREVMHAKDHVTGFRLSFEAGGHQYDIVEVTQVIHARAVATLLGLVRSTSL